MVEKMQEQARMLLKEAIQQLRQGCLLQGEEKYKQVAALAPELLATAEECCFRSPGGNGRRPHFAAAASALLRARGLGDLAIPEAIGDMPPAPAAMPRTMNE